MDIPVVDVVGLFGDPDAQRAVATRIGDACRDNGFFYVVGHGVDPALERRLEELSVEFFAQPARDKMAIAMPLGGPAWRGYFPVGDELTSGRPDAKEGVYFGSELLASDARVVAGIPLHGANLMPDRPVELGPVVLAWIEAMTSLAHALMRGVALSLDLEPDWFARHYTGDPTVLFRIFNYPSASPPADGGEQWGVGEHTDYGLLTILKQDDHGGLQVRSGGGWIEAPPVPDSFVCNIGDMLDRLTGGRYRSTPHRVVASVGYDRLSWPFFFDPSWDADVRPVGANALADDADTRWDGASVHEFAGTYGDYLLGKVGRVFPHLLRQVL
ncbi:MAG: isopenicillin N synthase family dioxygenase [Sporichthyaceae bacterium]